MYIYIYIYIYIYTEADLGGGSRGSGPPLSFQTCMKP